MIRYVLGDATVPEGQGPRVIVHVCNDAGGWGRGFVLALSLKWLAPERDYRTWFAGGDASGFCLGAVRFVAVAESLWVANLVGQHKTRTVKGVPPIRYEALREGLIAIRAFCESNQCTVHMPRIGCGLGGGDWTSVSVIIQEELVDKGVSVTVYDLLGRP